MPDPIAVFLDGTGNDGIEGNPANTNVFSLFEATRTDRQSTHYVKGIASDPTPFTGPFGGLRTLFAKLFDQAFGGGATARLQDAYAFICREYQPGRPLYLFGFSRGAFTASLLSGFLYRVGVLFAQPVLESDLAKAFYLYYHDEDGQEFADLVRQIERATGRNAEGIRTHFLGQWDTVETMEVARLSAPGEQLLLAIAERERSKPLPQWIDIACHALAIHEVRPLFEPNLWSGVSTDSQSLEQVWFAGAHADVGGGYTPEENRNDGYYARVSLKWMVDRARGAGLDMRMIEDEGEPASTQRPTTPEWKTFGGMHPRMRAVLATMSPNNPQGFYVHDSAIERLWLTGHSDLDSPQMQEAWREADCATMRFHYSQFFGDIGTPPFTPEQLRHHSEELWDFLSGKLVLSPDALTARLRTMLVFYYSPSSYILDEQTVPPEVVAQLIDALNRVEQQLNTLVHKNVEGRSAEYRAYLEWLTLALELPNKNPPGFAIVKKKVVKI